MHSLVFYSVLYYACIFYIASSKTTVAPVDANMSEPMKEHLNNEFSKCQPFNKNRCYNEFVPTVVTYFWPGDRVEIECMFCSEESLSGGRPKIWRTMSIRDALALSTTGAASAWQFNNSKSTFWRNVRDFAIKDLPNLHRKALWPVIATEDRPLPRFFQQDGKLVITNPGLEIQGVYNCYDDSENIEIDIIHFLIALAPLSMAPCYHIHAFSNVKDYPVLKNNTYDHISVDSLVRRCQSGYPEKNYSQLFAKIDDNFTYYQENKHFPRWIYEHSWMAFYDSVWRHKYFPITAHIIITEHDQSDEETNVRSFFAWTQWSECSACHPFRGWRSREGHCYVGHTRGKKFDPKDDDYAYEIKHEGDKINVNCCPTIENNLNNLSYSYNFHDYGVVSDFSKMHLERLNDLLSSDQLPFAGQQGIRLHSAFLMELFCPNRGQLHFDECAGLRSWFKYIFLKMPRHSGESMKPKRRTEERFDERKKGQKLKQMIPCFDYRVWQKETFPEFGDYVTQIDKGDGFAADVTGGYYFDIEPCKRDCPKLAKYFPKP